MGAGKRFIRRLVDGAAGNEQSDMTTLLLLTSSASQAKSLLHVRTGKSIFEANGLAGSMRLHRLTLWIPPLVIPFWISNRKTICYNQVSGWCRPTKQEILGKCSSIKRERLIQLPVPVHGNGEGDVKKGDLAGPQPQPPPLTSHECLNSIGNQ